MAGGASRNAARSTGGGANRVKAWHNTTSRQETHRTTATMAEEEVVNLPVAEKEEVGVQGQKEVLVVVQLAAVPDPPSRASVVAVVILFLPAVEQPRAQLRSEVTK